jgi:5'-3' exonuclease
MIAKKGIELARDTVTYVIGEDTDLLVLLCHYAERGMHDLYFKSSKAGGKCWHINSVAEALGESICRVLPVVHAICGCDSTSRLYGIGKGTALKKVRDGGDFLKCLETFCGQNGTTDEITSAGEKALVYLYGGQGHDTLDRLRKTKFCSKVARSSTTVEVQSLPPTNDAAKYHSFRVYCQVQEWMGFNVDPEKWGWYLRKGQLEPKTMDSPLAPDALLKLVSCQCKGNCDTQRCSCKRNDLECSSACRECKGLCKNSNLDPSTDDPSDYEVLS